MALTLGAACGLRQAEATGLTVDRVDFLRRQLTVDRRLAQVTPAGGPPVFGPPKTSKSYRTVPLADVAVAALASHVNEYGTGDDDLVLHKDGRPLPRPRFGEVWRAVRSEAGLSVASRFHNTRHTYASTLLSCGVSVPATADYMGHTPAELLKTYAHMVPADHERARSVVQAAFVKVSPDDAMAKPAED